MTWYFVNAGQQAGPISDLELDQHILAGKILPDTLVWRDGMAEWRPCREAKPAMAYKAPPATIAVAAVPPVAAGQYDQTTTEIVCAECGKLFPKENAIRHGDAWICAVCKPLHVQKLREGVAMGRTFDALEYAGLGSRLLAKFLDALIIGIPGAIAIAVAIAVVMPLIGKNTQNAEVAILTLGSLVILIILGMLFFQIWCLPKYGGTPGKRILGLKVVTSDGGPISWGRAFGRFFGEWVTGMIPLWIGYLIAAFDTERRTVHDHIAGTRVIKV